MDLKDFGIGAQILHELHINKHVITNSSQGHVLALRAMVLKLLNT